MVKTHDNGPGIDSTHGTGTDRIAYKNLRSGKYPGLKLCEDRADDGEGDIGSNENGGQRCYEQIEHFRHMLVQPFLDLTHQEHRYHHWYDVTLIAYLLHRENEDFPGRNRTLVGCDRPCVDEARMDHQKTDNRTEEDVSAEYAGCGDRYDTGQEYKCRVGDHIQESIPVAARKAGKCLTESLDKTHHKTGCDDCRQDRNEYVTDRLQQSLPQRFLSGSRCLDIIFGGSRHAGDIEELIIDLIDGSRTDDQLKLTV